MTQRKLIHTLRNLGYTNLAGKEYIGMSYWRDGKSLKFDLGANKRMFKFNDHQFYLLNEDWKWERIDFINIASLMVLYK